MICRKLSSNKKYLIFAYVVLFFLFIISLLIGRYPQAGFLPINVLLHDHLAQELIINLRLPRVISGLVLGISLSLSGLVMQTSFQNPLVEPGFLGVSQGAAFGASVAIVFIGNSNISIQILAIIFGLLGLILSIWISSKIRFGGYILRLVLAGIAVSAFFSAGIGIIKYMADPIKQLPDIVFWLLGGLWTVRWEDLTYILPVIVSGILLIYLLRWRLNVYTLSSDVAYSLGVNKKSENLLMLIVAVIMTAAIISISGIVSWVGLVIPNMARSISGPDTARAVPMTIAMGGIFVLICDDLARTLLAGEIPLSIFTALFGAVIFIFMISIKKGSLV